MPRLFTAIDLPPTDADRLAAFCESVDPPFDARWTPRDNFHITVRFIGDVDEAHVPAIEDALAAIEASTVPIRPLGLGVLPSRRNPRVLTVRIDRTDALDALYESAQDALARVSIDRERRSYKPHVTLARMDNPDPRSVQSFRSSIDDDDLPMSDFEADRLLLYESILTPEGAQHEIRSEFMLNLTSS